MMKYLNPATRKRPMFADLLNKFSSVDGKPIAVAIMCNCGDILMIQKSIYDHWQSGHFDEYEEYKAEYK